jgi:predicted TIM-barrel fold metal-dependent hydrolase
VILRRRVGVLAGAALLLLAAALRADRFEDAQAEAQRNLASPDGPAYDQRLMARFEEKQGAALAECASKASEDDLVPFLIVVELGGDGHVKDVLLRPPTATAICLRWSIRGSTFPKPPRSGFWMISVDPRTRAVSGQPPPTPAPGTEPSAAPEPTRTRPAPPTPGSAGPPAPTPTSSRFAPPPTAPPMAKASPVPTATPAPPPAPAARPAPPPSNSDAIVDVRLARLAYGGDADDALRRRDTLEAAQRRRVERGLVSGIGAASLSRLDAWRGAGRDRVLASIAVPGSAAPAASELAAVRRARKDGRITALEILAQGEGVAPDDARLEPWWSLAEELDLPVSIPLGARSEAASGSDPRFRAALGDPLRLEPVLIRHPRVRVCVGGAAWPFADSMSAILAAYPQVFVDTGGIALGVGRAELHAYLERLADAGFGDRILFASGAAEPAQLARAIEAIESATGLTSEQRRSILHDNAARWLGGAATRPLSGP